MRRNYMTTKGRQLGNKRQQFWWVIWRRKSQLSTTNKLLLQIYTGSSLNLHYSIMCHPNMITVKILL